MVRERVKGNKSHWDRLRTRSDFSNTEPSSILHCNVFVSAYIFMNYSILTSCNTVRCNVVQTAAYIILSRLHCNAQIEAAYIIFLLSRRWASTHLAFSHRQLVHLLAPKVLVDTFTHRWSCFPEFAASETWAHQWWSGIQLRLGSLELVEMDILVCRWKFGFYEWKFRLTDWC